MPRYLSLTTRRSAWHHGVVGGRFLTEEEIAVSWTDGELLAWAGPRLAHRQPADARLCSVATWPRPWDDRDWLVLLTEEGAVSWVAWEARLRRFVRVATFELPTPTNEASGWWFGLRPPDPGSPSRRLAVAGAAGWIAVVRLDEAARGGGPGLIAPGSPPPPVVAVEHLLETPGHRLPRALRWLDGGETLEVGVARRPGPGVDRPPGSLPGNLESLAFIPLGPEAGLGWFEEATRDRTRRGEPEGEEGGPAYAPTGSLRMVGGGPNGGLGSGREAALGAVGLNDGAGPAQSLLPWPAGAAATAAAGPPPSFSPLPLSPLPSGSLALPSFSFLRDHARSLEPESSRLAAAAEGLRGRHATREAIGGALLAAELAARGRALEPLPRPAPVAGPAERARGPPPGPEGAATSGSEGGRGDDEPGARAPGTAPALGAGLRAAAADPWVAPDFLPGHVAGCETGGGAETLRWTVRAGALRVVPLAGAGQGEGGMLLLDADLGGAAPPGAVAPGVAVDACLATEDDGSFAVDVASTLPFPHGPATASTISRRFAAPTVGGVARGPRGLARGLAAIIPLCGGVLLSYAHASRALRVRGHGSEGGTIGGESGGGMLGAGGAPAAPGAPGGESGPTPWTPSLVDVSDELGLEQRARTLAARDLAPGVLAQVTARGVHLCGEGTGGERARARETPGDPGGPGGAPASFAGGSLSSPPPAAPSPSWSPPEGTRVATAAVLPLGIVALQVTGERQLRILRVVRPKARASQGGAGAGEGGRTLAPPRVVQVAALDLRSEVSCVTARLPDGPGGRSLLLLIGTRTPSILAARLDLEGGARARARPLAELCAWAPAGAAPDASCIPESIVFLLGDGAVEEGSRSSRGSPASRADGRGPAPLTVAPEAGPGAPPSSAPAPPPAPILGFLACLRSGEILHGEALWRDPWKVDDGGGGAEGGPGSRGADGGGGGGGWGSDTPPCSHPPATLSVRASLRCGDVPVAAVSLPSCAARLAVARAPRPVALLSGSATWLALYDAEARALRVEPLGGLPDARLVAPVALETVGVDEGRGTEGGGLRPRASGPAPSAPLVPAPPPGEAYETPSALSLALSSQATSAAGSATPSRAASSEALASLRSAAGGTAATPLPPVPGGGVARATRPGASDAGGLAASIAREAPAPPLMVLLVARRDGSAALAPLSAPEDLAGWGEGATWGQRADRLAPAGTWPGWVIAGRRPSAETGGDPRASTGRADAAPPSALPRPTPLSEPPLEATGLALVPILAEGGGWESARGEEDGGPREPAPPAPAQPSPPRPADDRAGGSGSADPDGHGFRWLEAEQITALASWTPAALPGNAQRAPSGEDDPPSEWEGESASEDGEGDAAPGSDDGGPEGSGEEGDWPPTPDSQSSWQGFGPSPSLRSEPSGLEASVTPQRSGPSARSINAGGALSTLEEDSALEGEQDEAAAVPGSSLRRRGGGLAGSFSRPRLSPGPLSRSLPRRRAAPRSPRSRYGSLGAHPIELSGDVPSSVASGAGGLFGAARAAAAAGWAAGQLGAEEGARGRRATRPTAAPVPVTFVALGTGVPRDSWASAAEATVRDAAIAARPRLTAEDALRAGGGAGGGDGALPGMPPLPNFRRVDGEAALAAGDEGGRAQPPAEPRPPRAAVGDDSDDGADGDDAPRAPSPPREGLLGGELADAGDGNGELAPMDEDRDDGGEGGPDEGQVDGDGGGRGQGGEGAGERREDAGEGGGDAADDAAEGAPQDPRRAPRWGGLLRGGWERREWLWGRGLPRQPHPRGGAVDPDPAAAGWGGDDDPEPREARPRGVLVAQAAAAGDEGRGGAGEALGDEGAWAAGGGRGDHGPAPLLEIDGAELDDAWAIDAAVAWRPGADPRRAAPAHGGPRRGEAAPPLARPGGRSEPPAPAGRRSPRRFYADAGGAEREGAVCEGRAALFLLSGSPGEEVGGRCASMALDGAAPAPPFPAAARRLTLLAIVSLPGRVTALTLLPGEGPGSGWSAAGRAREDVALGLAGALVPPLARPGALGGPGAHPAPPEELPSAPPPALVLGVGSRLLVYELERATGALRPSASGRRLPPPRWSRVPHPPVHLAPAWDDGAGGLFLVTSLRGGVWLYRTVPGQAPSAVAGEAVASAARCSAPLPGSRRDVVAAAPGGQVRVLRLSRRSGRESFLPVTWVEGWGGGSAADAAGPLSPPSLHAPPVAALATRGRPGPGGSARGGVGSASLVGGGRRPWLAQRARWVCREAYQVAPEPREGVDGTAAAGGSRPSLLAPTREPVEPGGTVVLVDAGGGIVLVRTLPRSARLARVLARLLAVLDAHPITAPLGGARRPPPPAAFGIAGYPEPGPAPSPDPLAPWEGGNNTSGEGAEAGGPRSGGADVVGPGGVAGPPPAAGGPGGSDAGASGAPTAPDNPPEAAGEGVAAPCPSCPTLLDGDRLCIFRDMPPDVQAELGSAAAWPVADLLSALHHVLQT